MSRVLWQQARGRASHGRTARELLQDLSPLHLWLEVLFEPRDAWVDVYVCAVPFLPLVLKFRWAGWAATGYAARRRLSERRYR